MSGEKCYGKYKNVWLKDEEIEDFRMRYLNSNEIIELLSRFKFDKKKEYINDYAALLMFGQQDGQVE